MPSTGILKGNAFSLLISTDDGTSYDAALHGTSLNLAFDGKEINISNFDSDGWEEFLMGRKNWSGSFNGKLRIDSVTDKLNTDDLMGLFIAGTTVKLQFTTSVTGDAFWEGDAYIKGGSINFPDDEAGDASFDLRGTGALSQETVGA